MSYYILDQYLDDGAATINGVPGGLEPGEFLLGEWIEEDSLPRFSQGHPDRIFDMHPVSGGGRGDIMDGIVTLFHNNFISVLNDFGDLPLQYFKCGIRDVNTGELEGGFQIANLLCRIKALDLKRSKYELDSFGNPDFIETFHVLGQAANGAPIFRLDEFPTKIIVNEAMSSFLEKKIDEGALSGLSILATEYHLYDHREAES